MKSPETKMFGLALLIAGLVLCGIGLSWLLSPPQFQATARIQVELNYDENGSTSFDPYFIQTTFEILQSEMVLSNVVSALDLNNKWGVKYNHGATLKLHETLNMLRGKLMLAPVRNTKLISITAMSDDPKEAAEIANAIAESYRDYRIRTYKQLVSTGLKTLEEDYQTKEKIIQIMQTNVDGLRKNFGIIDVPSSYDVADDQMRQFNQRMIEAERDYKQSSDQLRDLKVDDTKKLRTDLPAGIHDTVLMDLLKKLSETEQAYETLTNNNLPTSVDAIQTQTRLNTLSQQIDDRLAGLMTGLESKVKSKQAALDSLHNDINEANAKYLADAAKYQPYYNAKIQLEQLQEQQRLFKAKIDATRMNTGIRKQSFVQLVDPALPSTSPAGPNRFQGATLLAIGLILMIGGWLLLKPSN